MVSRLYFLLHFCMIVLFYHSDENATFFYSTVDSPIIPVCLTKFQTRNSWQLLVVAIQKRPRTRSFYFYVMSHMFNNHAKVRHISEEVILASQGSERTIIEKYHIPEHTTKVHSLHHSEPLRLAIKAFPLKLILFLKLLASSSPLI